MFNPSPPEKLVINKKNPFTNKEFSKALSLFGCSDQLT
jgi:hypothetical protein